MAVRGGYVEVEEAFWARRLFASKAAAWIGLDCFLLVPDGHRSLPGGAQPGEPVPEDSMRSPVPARLLLLAMVCLVAAACGNSGDDTTGAAPATTSTTTVSGTTAAASKACADAAALKASVAELDQLDPAEAGKAGIQAALDKVQINLAALKASARTQWSSPITELDRAVEALKTTIDGLDGNSLLSSVPTIVSDLKRIDTAWTALQQQIDRDCG
jgi:hypothetical protein